MTDRLNGKIALVTGAGNGIGRATAIRFAAEGAKVIATTRNAERGESTLATIKKAGGQAIFIPANIRNKSEIISVVKQGHDHYGSLDVLCNCAGVLASKPFLEQTDEDFELISQTNFLSYVYAMQTVIPYMIEQGGGSIVNIASVSVYKPELNSYYYGAFKAAINKLSIDVAYEQAPNKIRVNVVCPGPVLTGMTPISADNTAAIQALADNFSIIGRMGRPEDIANMNLFLASDEAEWVTGATILVDGGTNLSGPKFVPTAAEVLSRD
ncbi:MAG: SDR family oxidoreductase [Coriobacteriales bacterium]|jgi:3-oxoacyl-[acyl-carrier protein] reductase|nr:SDR family oxidoreductase [Coriobacteriales bacterium]